MAKQSKPAAAALTSMTGFGGAEEKARAALVRVDIRTVNNRYFKLQGRFPDEIASLAGMAETRIRNVVKRGTVTVVVHLDAPAGTLANRIDTTLVKAYATAAKKLARAHGLADDLSVAAILALPGVIPRPEEHFAAQAPEIEAAFDRALARALERLCAMRLKEGAALGRDLLARVKEVGALLGEIAAELPAALKELQTRFSERVDALLAEKGLALDQASFAREAALLAERADVTEEVERLRSHCAQMRDALAAGGEAGRRLDFIAQEMLREAATMGAKIGSHALAEKIIHLKGQIDRLKEQAQNIE